jgi:hypothetical protein
MQEWSQCIKETSDNITEKTLGQVNSLKVGKGTWRDIICIRSDDGVKGLKFQPKARY